MTVTQETVLPMPSMERLRDIQLAIIQGETYDRDELQDVLDACRVDRRKFLDAVDRGRQRLTASQLAKAAQECRDAYGEIDRDDDRETLRQQCEPEAERLQRELDEHTLKIKNQIVATLAPLVAFDAEVEQQRRQRDDAVRRCDRNIAESQRILESTADPAIAVTIERLRDHLGALRHHLDVASAAILGVDRRKLQQEIAEASEKHRGSELLGRAAWTPLDPLLERAAQYDQAAAEARQLEIQIRAAEAEIAAAEESKLDWRQFAVA